MSVTDTFTSTPTSGNPLFAVLRHDNATVTMTPPSGWLLVHAVVNTSVGDRIAVYGKIAGASEPTTVTFTLSVNQVYGIKLYEFDGPWTAVACDDSDHNVGLLVNSLALGGAVGSQDDVTVLSIASFKTDPSASIAHSMTHDRVDNIGGPNPSTKRLLSIAVLDDVGPDTYDDTVTWTGTAVNASGMIIVLAQVGSLGITDGAAGSGGGSITTISVAPAAGRIVQAKGAAPGGSTNPVIALTSDPTPGNLVLVAMRHDNTFISTTPPSGYGPLFQLLDGSNFHTDAMFGTKDFLAVYGKIAQVGESRTLTFTQSQIQNTAMIAWEVEGSWDSELPMVDAWTINGTVARSAVQTLTLSSWDSGDTIRLTYDGHQSSPVSWADPATAGFQAAIDEVLALSDDFTGYVAGHCHVTYLNAVHKYVFTFSGATVGSRAVGAITATGGTGSATGSVAQTTTGLPGGTSLAAPTITPTIPGALVLAIADVRYNDTGVAHTLTGDRTDLVARTNATLSVRTVLDANATGYADTPSWSNPTSAITVMLSITDQGRDTVKTDEITTELQAMRSRLTGAGLSDTDVATAITTLNGHLSDKADLIADHAAVNRRVLLTLTDDLDARHPDITHQIGPTLLGLPASWTLRVPAGRYRMEFRPINIPSKSGIRFVGQSRDIEDWAFGDDPDDKCPTFYSEAHDLSPSASYFVFLGCTSPYIHRIRVEGDNTDPDSDTLGESPGGLGGTLPAWLSDALNDPTLPTGYGAYSKDLEVQHGFSIDGCTTPVVNEVYAYGVWGDGVAIRGGTTGMVGERIDVRYNGRQAVSVVWAFDTSLDYLWLPNSRRSSVDLEPSSASAVPVGSGERVVGLVLNHVYSDPNLSNLANLGRDACDDMELGYWHLGQQGAFIVASGGSDYRRGPMQLHHWTLNTLHPYSSGAVNGSPFSFSTTCHDIEIDHCAIPINPLSVARVAARFANGNGILSVHDNDFTGGQSPVLVAGTGTLIDTGNTY